MSDLIQNLWNTFYKYCLHWKCFPFAISGTFGVVEVITNASVTTLSPLSDENSDTKNETLVDCSMTVANNSSTSDVVVGPKVTNLEEIPAKEIIIVILMLGLWLYSIVLTRKAWVKILKEWVYFELSKWNNLMICQINKYVFLSESYRYNWLR